MDLSQNSNQNSSANGSEAQSMTSGGSRPKTKAQSLHGLQRKKPKPKPFNQAKANTNSNQANPKPTEPQPKPDSPTSTNSREVAANKPTPPQQSQVNQPNQPPNLRTEPPRPKTKHLQQEKTQDRLDRAKQTQQSQHVSKFNAPPRPDETNQSDQHLDLRQPSTNLPSNSQAMQADTPYEVESQATKSQTAQPTPASPDNKPSKLRNFWQKLRRRLRNRPRLAPTMATGILILVLGGYITYLNLPNLALKVAANQAGFSAQLPNYTPDGYSFRGPITYSTGQITLNFQSHADESNIKITQRKTGWDSQSLKANFVEESGVNPTVFKEKGLTIYFFSDRGQRTFTWVNQGIWYQLESSSQLSPEQLLLMATSM